MGLKPVLASNQYLNSGMDNEALHNSVAMILKDDSVKAQPNGSPLLSPVTKESAIQKQQQLASYQRPSALDQPLRVDVNGFRQPSSTLVSPLDGHSSLISTALPTPLMDFESSSNCSDSAFPQGDLYPDGSLPTKGAMDFRGFAAPKPSPGFPLRSPSLYAHLGPSTSSSNQTMLKPQLSKPAPLPSQASVQRRNGDISRKNFQEKVTRHRSELKFMIPKCGEANPSQLGIMLKKARKHTALPTSVETFLFEEHVTESVKKEPRKRKNILEDPDVTDVSDVEEEHGVENKRIRSKEKQVSLGADHAAISAAIDERQALLNRLVKEYKPAHKPVSIVGEAEGLSARCRPYSRTWSRKLLYRPKPFTYHDVMPSTSKVDNRTFYNRKSNISVEEAAMSVLHWYAMNPPVNIRRTLTKPPHLIDGKDLEEEMTRNGTTRRLEKEKRRQKEDTKASRDSSDYEDTDEDVDYLPEQKGALPKKKRKRGRPPRHDRKEDDGPPSKIGRKSGVSKHMPLYEGEMILDLTQLALSDDKPKYAQIQVPSFSIISDETLLRPPVECKHEHEDLMSLHRSNHPVAEQLEKARYAIPSKKPARVSVDKESNSDKTPLPSPRVL